jgi:hypothetical protein
LIKHLGKTRILSINVYADYGTNIILPEYIDEILNLFNMETIRMVLVSWKRLKQESTVLTLDK